jgi:hypothetical protein
MIAQRCVHGLDARFCSICNKRAIPSGKGVATLEEILAFLNHEQVRATYGAVAEVLGVIPRSMGALLGIKRPEASWIVAAVDGLPTDYSQGETHPELFRRNEIIRSGHQLALGVSAWRSMRRT